MFGLFSAIFMAIGRGCESIVETLDAAGVPRRSDLLHEALGL